MKIRNKYENRTETNEINKYKDTSLKEKAKIKTTKQIKNFKKSKNKIKNFKKDTLYLNGFHFYLSMNFMKIIKVWILIGIIMFAMLTLLNINKVRRLVPKEAYPIINMVYKYIGIKSA